jgi:AcrR family transcriptional regulator
MATSSETRPTSTERRQKLLDVAKDLFADRGYQATTMDDVAAAAGFTKPILYQHFASKEALYTELVATTSRRLLDTLGQATLSEETPRGMVESALRAFFRMVVTETAAYRLLFLQSPAMDQRTTLRRIESRITGFVEELIPLEGNPDARRQIAASIVGAAEGAATAYLYQQELAGWPPCDATEADRIAERISTFVWGGLRLISLG